MLKPARRVRAEHRRVPCPDCQRRGVLWLGGKDYADCPNCEGKGWFHMVTEEVLPQGTIFLPYAPKPLLISQQVD